MCSRFKTFTESRNCSLLRLCLRHALLLLALTHGSFVADNLAQSRPVTRLPQAAAAFDLRQGRPLEQQLAGGASHTYRMTLAAGQYVGLRLEQKGIDVAFSLFGVDGEKIAEYNNRIGYPDVESAFFISTVAGVYRLDVRPADQQAASGIYRVSIEEQREASARDRRLVAAQFIFNEAEQLRGRDEPETLRNALVKYQEALVIFEAEADGSMQLQTLLGLAGAHGELVERKQALKYLELALTLSRSRGDRSSEADALRGIAIMQIGSSGDAGWLDSLQRALQIKTEIGDRRGQAATLNHLGAAHFALNDYQKSLDFRHQALSIYRSLHNRRAEFNLLLALGTTNNSMGERVRAIDYYQQALSLSEGFRNAAIEADVLAKIGAVYYGMVEYPTALKYYKQALPLSRAARDYYTECQILKYIGSAYLAIGQYREAATYLTEALQIAMKEGKRELQIGALRNLAMANAQLGEPEKSRDYFMQELQICREMGGRSATALTLYVKAEFERDQGNYSAAIEDLSQAIDIMEALGAKVMARELRATYHARNRGLYELYIDILMLMYKRDPAKQYNLAALQLSEKARVRSLLEILNEAQANLRQGVDVSLLEKERSLQQQISAKADSLAQQQLNRISEKQLATANQEIADLTQQYQDLQTRIRMSSPRYAALTQPVTLTVSEIQQQILDEETVLLEYMLGRKRSYVWAVTKHSVASYELTGRVPIRLMMENFYDLLTARNKQVAFETKDERAARVAKADASLLKASAEMSRILLAPVASHLNKRRLLIVCDPTLEYIPFAVLPKPAAGLQSITAERVPLIADHEIINLPSASTLAVLRQELKGRPLAPRMLAVFGDPVFSRKDQRVLPALTTNPRNPNAPPAQTSESRKEEGQASLSRLLFTRREAETIAALVPEGQKKVALDFAANRQAVTSPDLSFYRYVHFATHALVDPLRPELSGVALSSVNRQGVEQKGFLRLYDIYNLKLPAELVVLSGCRTGLGRELRGEGLIGLTRGFMYAGAARVLVSLWDIHDEATAEFMSRFYKAMLGREQMTPAAALRAAQASMAKDPRWSSPYYWAAFVLQGEPK
jgi:CHAT domain-containing protein/tetratricopeptide (TPR) repeat protein